MCRTPHPDDLEKIGALALELGVELRPTAKKEGPVAVAMWIGCSTGRWRSCPAGTTMMSYSCITKFTKLLPSVTLHFFVVRVERHHDDLTIILLPFFLY